MDNNNNTVPKWRWISPTLLVLPILMIGGCSDPDEKKNPARTSDLGKAAEEALYKMAAAKLQGDINPAQTQEEKDAAERVMAMNLFLAIKNEKMAQLEEEHLKQKLAASTTAGAAQLTAMQYDEAKADTKVLTIKKDTIRRKLLEAGTSDYFRQKMWQYESEWSRAVTDSITAPQSDESTRIRNSLLNRNRPADARVKAAAEVTRMLSITFEEACP